MLQQPTKEKLYALRLHGMIEAIERQEQEEAVRELSFLDRLALLIDQQWDWRENQALTRRVKRALRQLGRLHAAEGPCSALNSSGPAAKELVTPGKS